MDRTWWNALDRRATLSLAASAVAMLLLLAGAAWWLLRTEHAVLFSDLRAQDAAAMTAELDKLKIPYALADNGSTLLVERTQVHAVRLKLMGSELPLHGSVGFELFNHTDFGMTEFAQKINYQRALQGELTRTILSFPEIREARVHLALPEQGLFRQNAARPKAAITLGLRAGRALRSEQVSGIQRLVAAAVPGLSAQEVTIVDLQGLALTRVADGEADAGAGSARLDLKRDTENYLARKLAVVLDGAFGPGQALASVDVTLNMDQVRVTTEDVIAAPDARGAGATGVLVRERESARDSAAPDPRSARGSSMQRDVEYQTGRRIEQVVSQPGAIRQLHAVAVLRQDLDAAQREQLQRLLAAAVGASAERGDTVVVQTLRPSAAGEAAPAANVPAAAGSGPALPTSEPPWIPVALAVLLLAALALSLRGRRRAASPLPALTAGERQAALQRVQGWLLQAAPTAAGEARAPAAGRKP